MIALVWNDIFLCMRQYLLQEYIARLEEAKRNDHRQLGKDQELFFFHLLRYSCQAMLLLSVYVVTIISDNHLLHFLRIAAQKVVSSFHMELGFTTNWWNLYEISTGTEDTKRWTVCTQSLLLWYHIAVGDLYLHLILAGRETCNSGKHLGMLLITGRICFYWMWVICLTFVECLHDLLMFITTYTLEIPLSGPFFSVSIMYMFICLFILYFLPLYAACVAFPQRPNQKTQV